jgi:hypothetical protein
MTDVDRLPADDGARWRDAQPARPEPDPALPRRRRRWQPLAAVVVAVAAGVVGCAPARRSADPAPAVGPADEIVRDGDTVAGQGYFLALPGRPVQLCGPASGPRRVIPKEPWPDETKVPEPCRNAVTVSGIDLAGSTSGRSATARSGASPGSRASTERAPSR